MSKVLKTWIRLFCREAALKLRFLLISTSVTEGWCCPVEWSAHAELAAGCSIWRPTSRLMSEGNLLETTYRLFTASCFPCEKQSTDLLLCNGSCYVSDLRGIFPSLANFGHVQIWHQRRQAIHQGNSGGMHRWGKSWFLFHIMVWYFTRLPFPFPHF